jgi:hypothetical protein
MLENSSKGIITYITSDGRSLIITSDMSIEKVATIQNQYWASYAKNFHPKFAPPHQIENNHRPKSRRHL